MSFGRPPWFSFLNQGTWEAPHLILSHMCLDPSCPAGPASSRFDDFLILKFWMRLSHNNKGCLVNIILHPQVWRVRNMYY